MVKSIWHVAMSISQLIVVSALVTTNGDDTRILQSNQAPPTSSISPLSRLFRLLRRQTLLNLPPRPQLPPQIVSSAAKHDLQCKNCPYSSCINALVIENGFYMGFSCWTQGEEVVTDNTWLRHQYGAGVGDFCYVNPYDLREPDASVRQKLPYCGSRSEMNFFLPVATTKTQLATECTMCPFLDCDRVERYPPGVSLDINCVFTEGSEQSSVTHANGTRKYYRTRNNNCYVSAATVQDISMSGEAGDASKHFTQILPPCGPIPHLRLDERPGSRTPVANAQSTSATRSSNDDTDDTSRGDLGELSLNGSGFEVEETSEAGWSDWDITQKETFDGDDY